MIGTELIFFVAAYLVMGFVFFLCNYEEIELRATKWEIVAIFSYLFFWPAIILMLIFLSLIFDSPLFYRIYARTTRTTWVRQCSRCKYLYRSCDSYEPENCFCKITKSNRPLSPGECTDNMYTHCYLVHPGGNQSCTKFEKRGWKRHDLGKWNREVIKP